MLDAAKKERNRLTRGWGVSYQIHVFVEVPPRRMAATTAAFVDISIKERLVHPSHYLLSVCIII